MALTKIPRGLLDTGIADSSDATAITIDSSENVTFAGNILKTGDLTINVSGDITLDADGGDINFHDNAVLFAQISNSSGLYLVSNVSNNTMYFRGNDGGSMINAITIDYANAGAATFNSGITLSGHLDIAYQGANITWGSHYPAIGNIPSSQATLLGNNIKAGASNNTVIRHANGTDAGNFIAITYNKGVTFHTGLTTTHNSEVAETTNERMRIDTNGRVGIGEVSPDRVFHVKRSDSGGTVAKFENSAGTVYIELNTANQAGGDAGYLSYDSSKNLGLWTDDTQRVTIDSAGTLRVGNPAGVPTPGSGWDANLDAIQVGEASAFRSGDSDYSAATVMSTNIYQTGGGDKLLNGTDFGTSYTQQGGNHYFYGYENGSANATPAAASNDLANPLIIYKGGGLQISGGSVGNTANGKAGIFWGGTPQNGADYCIRRTNDAWSGSNYAQLLIDWDTGVRIDVGADAYGKSFLEVVGSISTKSAQTKWNLGELSSSGRWDRSILANLHPSLTADGTHIGDCNDARNLGIRSLFHAGSPVSSNRPTSYGLVWANEHYVGDYGKGSKYISQVAVGHSSTPLEYRRNTDTSQGTTYSAWYSVDMTSTSDVREKKNIVDAPVQLDILKKVKVREFDYINDVEPNKELGMVAQELDTILPKYVEKAYDKDTGAIDEDVMWRIHYKKMIPMLIKSIQELSAEVETLKAK